MPVTCFAGKLCLSPPDRLVIKLACTLAVCIRNKVARGVGECDLETVCLTLQPTLRPLSQGSAGEMVCDCGSLVPHKVTAVNRETWSRSSPVPKAASLWVGRG